MADLSAIKLPNGTTYNLKDADGRKEAYLDWGGRNLTSNVTPVGASLSNEHSANRIAYLNPAAIQIEYTTNGGSTWTDSGYTNDDKMWLCTGSTGIAVGQSKSGYSSSTALTTNHWTRITLTGQNGTTQYVYTSPRKLLVNVTTAVSLNCLIEYKTGVSGASWQTFGTYAVAGWSGWNDIPLILSTFGGGSGQTGNYWYLRFTFKVASTRTDSYKGMAQVLGLRLFGSTDWGSASSNNGKGPFSSTGHLYSYDVGANATFPAKVTANGGFSGNLTGNVTGNVSGSAGSVAWSGVTGKPTATGSKATGISIGNHGTGTVIGVQSSTTTASKATAGTAVSIPNVTSAGSASNWVFENITVPKAASATACDDITSWSAGSGSASLTMAIDSSDSKKLNITFSHTHTAPTLQYTARSIAGVSGSVTASHVKSGGNGTAPTLGTAISITPYTFSDVTVPIKNTSASTFVTGTTHTITDNGHTHSI